MEYYLYVIQGLESNPELVRAGLIYRLPRRHFAFSTHSSTNLVQVVSFQPSACLALSVDYHRPTNPDNLLGTHLRSFRDLVIPVTVTNEKRCPSTATVFEIASLWALRCPGCWFTFNFSDPPFPISLELLISTHPFFYYTRGGRCR